MAGAWVFFLLMIPFNLALMWRVLRDPRLAIIYVCVWWIAVQSAVLLLR